MKNSKCENISPEFKKMWNNELIEIYGDDSHEAKDLIYKDNETPAWRVILNYIIRDIRYNSRLSTERYWVKFLIEETDILPGTIYAAINKMKKKRVLLEIESDKCLFPSFIAAYPLGIAEVPIMRKALLSDPIERMTFEYLKERKNRIIRDFLNRQYSKKKIEKKLKI